MLQSLILTGSLALESSAAGTAAKHASSRRDSALLAVGCAGRWQGYVCVQDKLVLPRVHTRRALGCVTLVKPELRLGAAWPPLTQPIRICRRLAAHSRRK